MFILSGNGILWRNPYTLLQEGKLGRRAVYMDRLSVLVAVWHCLAGCDTGKAILFQHIRLILCWFDWRIGDATKSV